MKSTPKNWPRISSAIFYQEPSKAIDWLCQAFGFEVRLKIEGEGGAIEHSELVFGEGLIMVGGGSEAVKRPDLSYCKSPRSLGGANTQSMMVHVDNVDAHYQRAKAAGAKILTEPKNTDYGEDYWEDRSYEVEDLEGHHWWFTQRIKDNK